MNVVLVGEDAAAVHTLRWLVNHGHQVMAVLASGRSVSPRELGLREFAQRAGIPSWPMSLLKDPAFAQRIRDEHVDLLLNVHTNTAIHAAVAAAPQVGAFNLQPAPPEYTGTQLVSWALYLGATTHGATLRWWGTALPEPIAYHAPFEIVESDGALAVYAKCIGAGQPLVQRLLRDAAAGAIPAIGPEPHTRRRFGDHVPEDGCLRWSRTAAEIVNFVRACDYLPLRSPWGHPRARVRDLEFVVTKATRTYEAAHAPPGVVGEVMGRSVCVAAKDEWLLLSRLASEGHHFDAADLLRAGDHIQDGAVFKPVALPVKAG